MDRRRPGRDDLRAALQELVAEGTLTGAQAARVAERLAESQHDPGSSRDGHLAPAAVPDRGRVAEVAGYVGGALLLGAAALFLASGWADLTQAARALLAATAAVLLLVLGAVIARGHPTGVVSLGRQDDSARRRLVSVVWTFAAAASAGAAAVVADGWELVAASATGAVVVGVAYALVPSAVAQLGAWLAGIGLVAGLVSELGDEPSTTPYAVLLVLFGAGWAALTVTRVLHEHDVGFTLAAAIALLAAQLPVLNDHHAGLGYALTALVAVAGFVGYLSARSWSVLSAGVLATTLVVPEAVHDWTGGSLSAAGSLLVAGLTLLGASAIGLRLRREAG